MPVMRLPSELLCKIFLMTQDGSSTRGNHPDFVHSITERWKLLVQKNPEDEAELSAFVNPFAWLNIMRVCRRWSAVAAACPFLWTTIHCEELLDMVSVGARGKGVYPELFLSRAGALPLTLSLSGCPEESEGHPIPQHLLPYIPRAREVWLMTAVRYAQFGPLLQSAPVLEALVVFPLPRPKHDHPLPSGGGFPALRSLAFIDGDIPSFATFLQPSFKQLRQLYIANGAGGTTPADLRWILSDTPNLEDLWYKDDRFCFFRIGALERPPKNLRLTLRKLAHVVLDYLGPKDDVLFPLLLPNLQLLTLRDGSHRNRLKAVARPPLEISALGDLGHIKKLRLRFQRVLDVEAERFMDIQFRPEHSVLMMGERSVLQVFSPCPLSDMMQGIVIGELEELWIEGGDREAYPSWILEKFLRRATSLRTINFHMDTVDELKAFLAVLYKRDSCPSLTVLEFGVPRLQPRNMKDLQGRLRDAVVAKKAAGHPVHTLRVGPHPELSQKGSSIDWKAIYLEWAQAVASDVRIRESVDELVIAEDEPLSRMPAPPIHHIPNTGFWQWPQWDDMK